MEAKPIVLVISHTPSVGESLTRMLHAQQCHAILVEDPDDALGHLDSPIDLVLSDLGLDAPHGRELLELWRSRRPATPYVLITHQGQTAVPQQPGPAGYLSLPLNGESTMSNLTKWIDESRQAEQGGTQRSEGDEQSAQAKQPSAEAPSAIRIPPGTTLEDLERAAVEQALEQHQGNRTHAAKELGISVRTLQRKLKAWGGARVSSQTDLATPDSRTAPAKPWSGTPANTNSRVNPFRPRLANV